MGMRVLTASLAGFGSMHGGAAFAQDAASGTDAFGERAGLEQVGLYSESQVRGFDLQSSGAYRIEGAYFSRMASLNDPVLASVSVRVGANASRLAYPSPSGVVNYSLRRPEPENDLKVTAGVRQYWSPFAQLDGTWWSPDRKVSLTAGVIARSSYKWQEGTEGDAVDVGAVLRWKPNETSEWTAFGSTYARQISGDYATRSSDGAVPPTLNRLQDYSPPWSKVRAANSNAGLLYRGQLSDWRLDASLFHSRIDIDRGDFTILAMDRNGDIESTLYLTPSRVLAASSAEVRAARVYRTGDIQHLVSASLRGRRSTVELADAMPIFGGRFNVRDAVPVTPAPGQWQGGRGEDAVEQLTASAGYGAILADRLEVRLGAHRTRYDKTVDLTSGARSRGVENAWFYNASAVATLTPRASLFSSYVTGLEEAGFAPQNASNRNEVMPPVRTRQMEVGLRYAPTPGLTLLGAVFDVSKPTYGLRGDGVFGAVGRVRHRGVEGSITGQLDARTTILLGGVLLEPEVKGVLVDAGLVQATPPATPRRQGTINIQRQLSETWSIDGQINYLGRTYMMSTSPAQVDAVVRLDVGARARLQVADRPATLRVYLANLTDERGWYASAGGAMWPVAPRSLRASLTVDLR